MWTVQALQIADAKGNPTGRWRMTATSDEDGGGPHGDLNHDHGSAEEAQACERCDRYTAAVTGFPSRKRLAEEKAKRQGLTDAQVKHLVDRFLSWKLPADFNPDAGISFKAEFNEHTAHPMKHEPSGTNLLDATQADAMVRHMLEGMPDA